jgi:hypothetical protein
VSWPNLVVVAPAPLRLLAAALYSNSYGYGNVSNFEGDASKEGRERQRWLRRSNNASDDDTDNDNDDNNQYNQRIHPSSSEDQALRSLFDEAVAASTLLDSGLRMETNSCCMACTNRPPWEMLHRRRHQFSMLWHMPNIRHGANLKACHGQQP